MNTPQDNTNKEQPVTPPVPQAESAMPAIIAVDDEPSMLSLVTRILRRDFEITTFSNVDDAIANIRDNPDHYDIALTDLAMPGKNGIDFIRELMEIDSDITSVVMTGFATTDTALDCLREGVFDFISKPFRPETLRDMMIRAIGHRRATLARRENQTKLERTVEDLDKRLATTTEQLQSSYKFMLEALISMLDAREQKSGTGKHSIRVRAMTELLTVKLDMKGAFKESISIGALLHDIGKIGIPDRVLLKESKLNDEEWVIMRHHPQIGFSLLRENPFLAEAAEMVYTHHEWYNGKGYPRGLKGEEICLGSRLFSVIDAYDAMRSERLYRSSLSPETAMAELQKNMGTQFDPDVVEIFIAYHPELEKLWSSIGQ